jgi:hypothetical protein
MPEPLALAVHKTPNPNAMKFTLNRVIAKEGVTYRPAPAQPGGGTAQEPAPVQPAWAQRLLGISGVTQVFALHDFISVHKASEADWAVIGPQVEQVLRQVFA